MRCSCGEQMIAELVLTGGCMGHYGEDDRCYCDNPDAHIEFQCPSIRKRGTKHSNNKPIRISTLGDKYAIGRWFTENYTKVDT